MNEIRKRPISKTGYEFIPAPFLPKGKDEYHLRDLQNKSGIEYRKLTASELDALKANQNVSSNWDDILVSDPFDASLVKNCTFHGKIRIGKLEPVSLEFHNVCQPVGLYNSNIISCDLGHNVIVSNVNYLSHYIVGNEVILLNLDEVHVTDHAKFGNGIIKEGEQESVRIWVEVCNENAGRKILPFNGMLPGDAFIWSRFRDDEMLMRKLREFTESKFDRQRGYYGKIGDRTVVKNTSIIKDVWIGSDAYIKGANKLKNLTIRSTPEAPTQIGEGCEIVNGIIGYGCRLFYGVKAVRFVMASHSQLKYGARLINSFLGNNSTISCCEVLNSLIFPGHEQHHNNSFLCAALVMGQSNIAAGATIGSNHNSRAADGEFVTGRGFWPGLCVSLKHNSRFATFSLLAKGDYAYELDIPLPFSLISNDLANNELTIMPAYWFLYNLYALARNASKYNDRDKRIHKIQNIEYDFLAPDSVNEIFVALDELRKWSAIAKEKNGGEMPEEVLLQAGTVLLENPESDLKGLKIKVQGYENSNRCVCLSKVKEAYAVYKKLIVYYGVTNLIDLILAKNIANFDQLKSLLPSTVARLEFVNIGGQLMPKAALDTLLQNVRKGVINGWDEVHAFYETNGRVYQEQKLQHAYASLVELLPQGEEFTKEQFARLLQEAEETKEWMVKNIYDSRAKDYQTHFRKMLYNSEAEMEAVIGKLDDNVFIAQQKEEFRQFTATTRRIRQSFDI